MITTKRKLRRYRLTAEDGTEYVTFGKSVYGVRAKAKRCNVVVRRVDAYPGRWGLGAVLADELRVDEGVW